MDVGVTGEAVSGNGDRDHSHPIHTPARGASHSHSQAPAIAIAIAPATTPPESSPTNRGRAASDTPPDDCSSNTASPSSRAAPHSASPPFSSSSPPVAVAGSGIVGAGAVGKSYAQAYADFLAEQTATLQKRSLNISSSSDVIPRALSSTPTPVPVPTTQSHSNNYSSSSSANADIINTTPAEDEDEDVTMVGAIEFSEEGGEEDIDAHAQRQTTILRDLGQSCDDSAENFALPDSDLGNAHHSINARPAAAAAYPSGARKTPRTAPTSASAGAVFRSDLFEEEGDGTSSRAVDELKAIRSEHDDALDRIRIDR